MNHYETFEPAPDTWQIEEPGTVIADSLILTLRESNALEFMPQEQRLALIWELCKPSDYCLDTYEDKGSLDPCNSLLAHIRETMKP